ncbi:aminotransferase class I/II-fold pyridoxal phosphate-dependent enzyme [Candidatus Microgenomates bacterium]|nr:aminotransferase class I/II-fold pyridoxal phosphate-dependent enzyme [Candidatus Microgenomates bacterium]
MIAISLSPNTQKKDYMTALAQLFSPWSYIHGQYVKKVEQWFQKYFNARFAISFDSGRSAQYAILSALGIGKGDEVLVQAFTCVAVPNSVLWTGAKPIYVDIEKNSYNMSPEDLVKKINKNSKAIIIQHTFGQAAKIKEICQIAKKHKLVLIEDCAHGMGASVNSQKLGTFGEVAFFSFGRDKVVSSVFGGMVVTRDKRIGERVKEFQKNLAYPSVFWIVQQLLHPIFFSIILPTYNFFNLGKVILKVSQALHLLGKPVAEMEKKGQRPKFYPRKLPNSLARLALVQLGRLESFNKKRKVIAAVYAKELSIKIKDQDIHVRFPLLVNRRDELLKSAKSRGILLGDWYSHVVDPKGVDLTKIGYAFGSCPMAEQSATKIINLPTYPRMSVNDVRKVVRIVKDYASDKNS